MKKMVFRVLVILMLLMVLAPFVMVLIRATGWNPFPATQTWSNLGFKRKLAPENSEGSIVQAFIANNNTDEKYDISKYAHFNGEGFPLPYETNYYDYKVGGIEYRFDILDIENPKITFYMYPDNITYIISDDGNNVILTRQGGFPLWRNSIVCPLPSPDCFYSPIRITGVSGYAIVLLEPNADGNETVTVYVKNKKNWEQVDVAFPDGTVASSLNGGARRRFDLRLVGPGNDLYNMEVYVSQEEKSSIYTFDFSEGLLRLTTVKTVPESKPTYWKF